MIVSKLSEHNPESQAVITEKRIFSYSALINEANKNYSTLKKLGVNPGDYAAVISDNNPDFIPLLLALWNCRAVPVIFNIRSTEKDLEELIDFSGAKFLFINSSVSESFDFSRRNTITFPFPEKEINTENFFVDQIRGDDTAVVIFSSGSSGEPKGVMLSYENLIQSAVIGNKVLRQTSADRWLASLPFYHIGGFSIIIRTLIFGASIVIPDSLSYNDLIYCIDKFHPTLISLVSNQLKGFVEENIIPPKELRTALLGGGFFSNELVLHSIREGWKIAKVYGSTETSSFISFMDTEEVKQKPAASGKEIPPNKILIGDEGEIIVKSPALMKGYLPDGRTGKDETGNANTFKDKFYFTGDIGYIDSEGYLFVESKRDDLIVSGGENISPAEIEKEISAHPKVNEAGVVGIANNEWGEAVSAAVVLKPTEKLSEKELKNFLKNRIASFKIPKNIIFVLELPKTQLGKLEREKIRELFREK
ncbi:MAG TPA: class I adenylate-forming enzyme family protein [Ignavibacteriaceae bacterium]|nr:class I adenylate-forming enzyme family protein [Ignavibacteriaceae bacterium]